MRSLVHWTEAQIYSGSLRLLFHIHLNTINEILIYYQKSVLWRKSLQVAWFHHFFKHIFMAIFLNLKMIHKIQFAQIKRTYNGSIHNKILREYKTIVGRRVDAWSGNCIWNHCTCILLICTNSCICCIYISLGIQT